MELAATMILFFFFFPKDFQLPVQTGLSQGWWGRAHMASVAGDTSDFLACQLRVVLTQFLRQTILNICQSLFIPLMR